MKHILLLSYGIIGHDGPLKNLTTLCNAIGKTDVVAFAIERSGTSNSFIHVSNRNERNKLKSLYRHVAKSILRAKTMTKEFVLISDDFISTISAVIVKVLFKPVRYVHYARELYYGTKMPGWGKLFVWVEKFACKIADTVVCCNGERAKIMYEKYNLKKMPIILENRRKLEGDYNKDLLDKKYKVVLNEKIRLIETGGCDLERGTINLVKAVSKLPQCCLFIVGKGHDEDYQVVSSLINSESISNVYILDRVPLAELRYLVDQCQVGVVIYHKNDLNNIYCASGKVYEYLYEGIPIITSENASLVAICNKYHIGVADDNFVSGLIEIIDHMDQYRSAVKLFQSECSVEMYLEEFAKDLLSVIE